MPSTGCDYALGVDGGGTKTIAIVVDGAGRELGLGRAGPSNYHTVGEPAAAANLGLAIGTALAQAGITRVNAACLGIAGSGRPEDACIMERLARPAIGGTAISVVNDALIALVAGTGGRRYGVVIISGTGSIAYGVDASGREWRADGWGYILGDEGSAYDIARQGLIAALRAQDGRGPATTLAERFTARLELAEIEGVPFLIHDLGVPEVATLAPLVVAVADEGDAVAQGILAGAGEKLALAAQAVIAGLYWAGQPFPVILSGGVFQPGGVVVQTVRERLAASAPQAQVILRGREPAWGAALLALQM
ncbi:MAG: BadF/BadG/BcrA/BcrD ATPase family protein [Chloroflexota bacterium]|nr:BadF/BadG/BcrA/BcrD ATPase family protein [Chloroflexota bacterium]